MKVEDLNIGDVVQVHFKDESPTGVVLEISPTYFCGGVEMTDLLLLEGGKVEWWSVFHTRIVTKRRDGLIVLERIDKLR
jgi:hypothetical protein